MLIELLPRRFIIGKSLSQFDLSAAPTSRATDDRADARVDFSNTRQRNYLANVVFANSSASHDCDPSTSLSDESCDSGRPSESGVGSSGGEDSCHACVNQLLERLRTVRRVVEGAMKGDRQGLRCADQHPNLFYINHCIWLKYSSDDSMRAQ